MSERPSPPPASRDREATAQRILTAARAILAQEGPSELGINAVARAARCDKQLIYRYFGGMSGLIEALGRDLAEWWIDRLGPPPQGRATYAAFMRDIALRLVTVVRSEPMMQTIMLWELTDSSAQVRQIARSRSQAWAAFIEAARGGLVPPEDLDAGVIDAVIMGGLQHLVLASRTTDPATGLALATQADWDRIEHGLCSLIDRVYGTGEGRAGQVAGVDKVQAPPPGRAKSSGHHGT